MRQSRPGRRLFLILLSIAVLSPLGVEVTRTQQRRKPFVPVTDAMLQNPAAGDWLAWAVVATDASIPEYRHRHPRRRPSRSRCFPE